MIDFSFYSWYNTHKMAQPIKERGEYAMKKCLAFIIMICCIWNLVGCNDDTRKNGTQGKTETGAEEVNLKYSAGDIITFGSYEQDNDTSNGAEPIEWRVLDVQE